jgi:isopentenyl diphosphate isomerase/L-lactate dehydrogenase-like FMN-dependent dehydrogenase
VLAILRREFNLVMAQCGKQSVADIRASSIVKRT